MITPLHLKNCTTCEKGTLPLMEDAENALLKRAASWEIDRSGVHTLKKRYVFNSFFDAHAFAKSVTFVSKDEQQHPAIRAYDTLVFIELTTPAIGGLSENDFIMAAKIEEIYFLVLHPAIENLESAMLVLESLMQ